MPVIRSVEWIELPSTKKLRHIKPLLSAEIIEPSSFSFGKQKRFLQTVHLKGWFLSRALPSFLESD